MLGMGTYITIVPVYQGRLNPARLMSLGLNTEHHAVPERHVCFIYNHGGSMLKWYRDTFAAAEYRAAGTDGVYPKLLAEMPTGPSDVFVLPHFAPTGPPEFISDSAGLIAGLHLDTTRGQILKGILDGSLYYLKECIDQLPLIGLDIASYRAVGGGSRSEVWLQSAASVLLFLRSALVISRANRRLMLCLQSWRL